MVDTETSWTTVVSEVTTKALDDNARDQAIICERVAREKYRPNPHISLEDYVASMVVSPGEYVERVKQVIIYPTSGGKIGEIPLPERGMVDELFSRYPTSVPEPGHILNALADGLMELRAELKLEREARRKLQEQLDRLLGSRS